MVNTKDSGPTYRLSPMRPPCGGLTNHMMVKAGLLGTLSLLATAGVSEQDAHALRRVVEPGKEATYRLDMMVTTPGKEFSYAAFLAQVVTRVESDGAFTVETTSNGGVYIVNGQQSPAPNSKSTVVFLANGVVKEIVGSEATPEAYRIAFLGMFQAPPMPVRPEDHWTFESRSNPVTGANGVRITYRVEGMEWIGLTETAKVRVSLSEQQVPDPMSMEGTLWIDVRTGWLMKSEAVWRNAPFGGERLDATVTLQRQET